MYVRNDINIFFSSTGVMTLSFSKHSNLTLFAFVMISLISFICWISLLFSSSNANEFFTFHSKAIVMKENERNKGVKAILILKLFHMNACKIISFILRVSTCTHMYFKRVIFACTISCRNWFFIKLSLIWLSAFLNVPIFWYNYINYLTFGVVLDFSRHRFPPKTLNSKTQYVHNNSYDMYKRFDYQFNTSFSFTILLPPISKRCLFWCCSLQILSIGILSDIFKWMGNSYTFLPDKEAFSSTIQIIRCSK